MATKSYNNRIEAADLRNLVIKQVKEILEDENYPDVDYKKELLMRLAPSAIPRINEHTGSDGEEIKLNIINYGAGHTPQLSTTTLPIGIPNVTTTI